MSFSLELQLQHQKFIWINIFILPSIEFILLFLSKIRSVDCRHPQLILNYRTVTTIKQDACWSKRQQRNSWCSVQMPFLVKMLFCCYTMTFTTGSEIMCFRNSGSVLPKKVFVSVLTFYHSLRTNIHMWGFALSHHWLLQAMPSIYKPILCSHFLF